MLSETQEDKVKDLVYDINTGESAQVEMLTNFINGGHFFYKDYIELASSGNAVWFGVTVPAGSKQPHIQWDINGNTVTRVEIWEGATLSGGTLVSSINNNRTSINTSVVTIVANPIVSGATPTSGLSISKAMRGRAGTNPVAARISANVSRDDELMLGSSNNAEISYLIELKTGDDLNIVDYRAAWYEHTDKN